MGARHDHVKPNTTPAPGSYAPEKFNSEHTPAFTFGIKVETKNKNNTPGKYLNFY